MLWFNNSLLILIHIFYGSLIVIKQIYKLHLTFNLEYFNLN